MQTYRISSDLDDFAQLKATLDAKVLQSVKFHRKHMTGIIKHYDDNDLILTEYVYSFSSVEGEE